ncbi:MAG: pyridoxamine 5'-phosphate oxidase [Acidobacteria bacterium]|nr:pyridoxamine 5'-phosphate oxidase [Acidobacteriota bacterium]
MDQTALAALRQDYLQHELSKKSVAANPFDQFSRWFDEAVSAQIVEPNAMHLGTATREGLPSGRTVLLKGYDKTAFKFYTNYGSAKARDLAVNPSCYLHFFWKELERQIFIRGTAAKTTDQESDEYFATRPYKSQIGAWASEQSSTIESRKQLEDHFEELTAKYPEGNVPRPPFWGGFRVVPGQFEFWQGRRSRLHDRIYYEKENGGWKISRLSP